MSRREQRNGSYEFIDPSPRWRLDAIDEAFFIALSMTARGWRTVVHHTAPHVHSGPKGVAVGTCRFCGGQRAMRLLTTECTEGAGYGQARSTKNKGLARLRKTFIDETEQYLERALASNSHARIPIVIAPARKAPEQT